MDYWGLTGSSAIRSPSLSLPPSNLTHRDCQLAPGTALKTLRNLPVPTPRMGSIKQGDLVPNSA
jgi:hypothetical protein